MLTGEQLQHSIPEDLNLPKHNCGASILAHS